MRLDSYLKLLSANNKILYVIFNLIEKLFVNFIRLYQIHKAVHSVLTELEKRNSDISIFKSTIYIENEYSPRIVIRNNYSDIKVCEQIFLKHEYQCVVDTWNSLFYDKPRVIVDVGANIGVASLFFAKSFRNTFLIAVEADYSNYKLLKENLKIYEDFTVLHKALWNTNKKLFLDNNFRDGKSWSIRVTDDPGNIDKMWVDGVTMKNLLAYTPNGEIDILKIDIEGAESVVFNKFDCANFLPYIKLIAIEIHDEVVDRNTIYQILNDNQFFYFDSGETTLAFNKRLVK